MSGPTLILHTYKLVFEVFAGFRDIAYGPDKADLGASHAVVVVERVTEGPRLGK